MLSPLRFLSVLCCLFLPAFAADWPQWRGLARTGETGAALEKLPQEPRVIWRQAVGDGFASPVMANGRVFYLDNQEAMEVAHAVEATTGKEIWRATIYSSHKDGFGIGPRCTPVVDGDRVYVQSAKGELQCLSAKDGKVLWRKNYVDDFGAIYIGEKGKAAGASRHGAAGSPLIDGEHLIAQVGSANGAAIVAFNKANGEVAWKAENDQTAYAAPIIGTIAGVRQFLSFTAEALISLDPQNGHLLWRVPLKTALGRHVTTPVIWHDLVFVASHQIGLVATRVSKSAEGLTASEAWVNKAMAFNFASPVLVGDHLYGLGSSKNVVCLNAATGELAWEQAGLNQTSADRAEAAFLVFGKNILMLSDTGELILFAADSKAYKELGRVQVCGTTWCNPAFADGHLYLRDKNELLCVDLK